MTLPKVPPQALEHSETAQGAELALQCWTERDDVRKDGRGTPLRSSQASAGLPRARCASGLGVRAPVHRVCGGVSRSRGLLSSPRAAAAGPLRIPAPQLLLRRRQAD